MIIDYGACELVSCRMNEWSKNKQHDYTRAEFEGRVGPLAERASHSSPPREPAGVA